MAQSWPGQMRTVYGDHQRFIDTIFHNLMEKYLPGWGEETRMVITGLPEELM